MIAPSILTSALLRSLCGFQTHFSIVTLEWANFDSYVFKSRRGGRSLTHKSQTVVDAMLHAPLTTLGWGSIYHSALTLIACFIVHLPTQVNRDFRALPVSYHGCRARPAGNSVWNEELHVDVVLNESKTFPEILWSVWKWSISFSVYTFEQSFQALWSKAWNIFLKKFIWGDNRSTGFPAVGLLSNMATYTVNI